MLAIVYLVGVSSFNWGQNVDKKQLIEKLKKYGVKVVGNYVRKEDLRKVVGTGEMSKKDLEPGGEYYEAANTLADIAGLTGLFKEVRPFDVYQGPFALLTNGDKIWFGSEDGLFYVEQKGGRGFELDADGIESLYESEKKAQERRSNFRLVKSKFSECNFRKAIARQVAALGDDVL